MNNTSSIVGNLSEFKETPKPKKSLVKQIKEAKTMEEIKLLLELGSTYKKASLETQRKWSRAAAARLWDLA